MQSDVTIIDYGLGNILSVRRGFEHFNAKIHITSDPSELTKADRLVLPGVGAFGNAMRKLKDLNMIEAIHFAAEKNKPILGICLGMQLLLNESEEFGKQEGLGLIPGNVIPVPNHTVNGESLKIPHIGWDSLLYGSHYSSWEGTLLESIRPENFAYFIHSFMAVTENPLHRIAECNYGGHLIPAVIQKEKTIGCQFHPEKSGEYGLEILKRFLLL